MTFDPADPNRRTTTTDPYVGPATTTDADLVRTPPRSRNTGMIGAIVGVIAVVAVVFFVWRGVDRPGTPDTTGTTTSQGTVSPAPAPSPATPAAPANPPAAAGGTQP